MKNLIFLVLIAINPLYSQVSLELRFIKDTYVLGEPIEGELVFKNLGKEEINIEYGLRLENPLIKMNIEGGIKEECKFNIRKVEWRPCAHKVIKGGEEERLIIRVGGIVKAGTYRIWFEYKGSEGREEVCGKRVYNKDLVSNIVNLKVEEPTGIDKEVYDKYSYCGRIPLTGDKAKELLEKFPTSTYAGWVLYNISNINYIEKLDIEMEYKYSKRTREDVKRNYQGNYTEKDVERIMEEMKKEKERGIKRVNDLEEFIKERPNFALKEYIEFEIGFWSFYVGDYKKAKEKIDKIMKESKNSLLIEKSKKIEEIIRREGLIK